MTVETPYKSMLRMNKMFIVESSFTRSEDDLSNIRLDLNVDREIEALENDTYAVTLSVTVADTEERLRVYVKCKGYFTMEGGVTSIVERNTIAIMFPYIRSQITAITAQPEMLPIVLPPMNIAAMLEQTQS